MILILWVFHITLHGGLNLTLYSESSLVIFFLTCLRYGVSNAQLSSRISQGLSCPLVLSVFTSNTQGEIQELGCYIILQGCSALHLDGYTWEYTLAAKEYSPINNAQKTV